MKTIKLSDYSRYTQTPLYQEVDQETKAKTNVFYWGRWQPPKFPRSEDDIFHLVRDADVGRLDLLSYKYYRTVALWWVIAYVNSIDDPFVMDIGVLLRIPAPQGVLPLLKGTVITVDEIPPVSPSEITFGYSNNAFFGGQLV